MDPAGDRSWAAMLDTLEAWLDAAEDLLRRPEGALPVPPWEPPGDDALGAIPAELVVRARVIRTRQQELIDRLGMEADRVNAELVTLGARHHGQRGAEAPPLFFDDQA
jgi:hypothetical protein